MTFTVTKRITAVVPMVDSQNNVYFGLFNLISESLNLFRLEKHCHYMLHDCLECQTFKLVTFFFSYFIISNIIPRVIGILICNGYY